MQFSILPFLHVSNFKRFIVNLKKFKMNVHIAYISLLVLAFGFVAYLKFELDGLEDGYSEENVELEEKYGTLVAMERKLKSELKSCNGDADKLKRSIGSESQSLKNSLDVCQNEQVSFTCYSKFYYICITIFTYLIELLIIFKINNKYLIYFLFKMLL